jgi:peptide/nickel transport system permease protein
MATRTTSLETVKASRASAPGPRNSVIRFFADPKAAVAGALLALFISMALFAPIIAPYGPNEQDYGASLEAPSWSHPFGTDRLGRDILSRVMYGTQISLRIGIIAVSIGVGIGVPIGLVGGYFGKLIDEILMRLVDAVIAFPNLILLLLIITVIGASVNNVMIALGMASFPIYARLVRGQTLSLRERDFVLAARALGARGDRIVFRHILPNAIQPVIVQGSLALGAAVIAEAGLSFLGIGITPPDVTWGLIIRDGFAVIRQNAWISVLPGFAIVLFVLAVNLLGDRLRDRLDPRLRGTR